MKSDTRDWLSNLRPAQSTPVIPPLLEARVESDLERSRASMGSMKPPEESALWYKPEPIGDEGEAAGNQMVKALCCSSCDERILGSCGLGLQLSQFPYGLLMK